ncbi:oxidoreductase [Vibrio sp. HA2012]|uniref:Gfo/Idh/MocA family protein n=1 Tax=Vibrio sp. HA2012 TaxID=1971595 RepID=UPI000C2B77B5|nr:Gfo/Idh/MocA family oxidoreductase [Vibrio sp. HA2012]PJC87107.1 oxidoreductase [Vibrio sp. HA2012]
MQPQAVRWGIAGIGQIAHRFAADLTQHCPDAMLYGAAARSVTRATEFISEFQGIKSYASYEEMAADPNIEAVYIATINPTHKSLIELYLQHGKHVLVEKPALTNTADWDEMFTLARKQNRLLIEAMKTITFPAYRSLRQFIQNNHIQISHIDAAYGGAVPFDINNRVFAPDLCGGASLDVGVYPLWLYADLCDCLGLSTGELTTQFVQNNPQTRVDETAIYQFSGPVSGTIGASITNDMERIAILSGPNVKIVIQDKWWNPKVIDIEYQGEQFQISPQTQGGGFEHEIQHVSRLIQNKASSSDIIKESTSRTVIEIVETSLIKNGFTHLTARNI